MTLILITLAPVAGAPLQHPNEALLEAGAGMVGDRHYSRMPEIPGQNLTLVEAEEIDAFNQRHGMHHDLAAFRRNLVMRGVRLNDLVGRVFTLGAVRLRGVELCEPCERLGSRLAGGALTVPAVVADLVGRGGLRADILRGGSVRLGDTLSVEA